MGRKIPGRKHRGVKDPEVQRIKRDELVKNKINAPPEVIDFQEVPKSVERLLKINNAIKDGTYQKKKKMRKKKKRDWLINTEKLEGKNVILPGMTRPEKPVPSFVQQPGESDSHFLYRIDQACHDVIQEAKFEKKYGVSVNVDHETGEMSIMKDKPVELEEPLQKERYEKKKKDPSMKKEKKKLKEKERKLKKIEKNQDDFEKFHDEVKFGEIVHAPPSLTTLPKKAEKKDITPKPGKKDLLLKSVLQHNTDTSSISSNTKWKNLPVVAKQKKELQRLQAVEAYRMLKTQKRRNPEAL